MDALSLRLVISEVMRSVAEIRNDIDKADDAIVAALNARFALSDEMLKTKQAIRDAGGDCPPVDPKREKEICERMMSAAPLAHRDTVFSIYERILGGSRGMVETIARGVCIQNGKVLLCKAKGGKSTYLPGGHIEFGETGAAALVREIKEELGVNSSCNEFLTIVENSFLQHGRHHAEINLVYKLDIPSLLASPSSPPASQEDWIEFEWHDVHDLDNANLLPVEMVGVVKAAKNT